MTCFLRGKLTRGDLNMFDNYDHYSNKIQLKLFWLGTCILHQFTPFCSILIIFHLVWLSTINSHFIEHRYSEFNLTEIHIPFLRVDNFSIFQKFKISFRSRMSLSRIYNLKEFQLTVSQICSLICFPSIVIILAPNSTP